MMKLKGKVLDSLSPEKREKMERTLERMRDVRRTKDMRLAKIVKAKKEWAEKEKKKGQDVIKRLEQQKEDIIKQIEDQKEQVKIQMIKLEGCLLVLDELDEEAANMIDAEKSEKIE